MGEKGHDADVSLEREPDGILLKTVTVKKDY